MKSGWKQIRLGDVCEINSRNINKKFLFDEITYLDISSVGSGEVDLKNVISLKEAPSRAKRLAKNGNTIISTVRPGNRSFAFLKNIPNNTVVSTGFAVLNPKKEFTDPRFLFYLISQPSFTGYLVSIEQGANYPAVNSKDINDAKVVFPPLPTQRKIAAILSAYDDLIENNLKRIKLLEEKAQLTYEEWFVRMKFPGHESTPINEETGLPERWEKQDLNNYISIKHGFAFKGEYFSEEPTNKVLLTPGNFKIGGGIKLDKLKYYKNLDNYPIDFELKKHDLLITMTDLSKNGDTLGYPLLVPSSQDKIYLHNQRLGKVIPNQGLHYFPKYFLRMYFQDFEYRSFVVGSSNGSTVKHSSPKKILWYKPSLPNLDSDMIKNFDIETRYIFEAIDSFLSQNILLQEARDILLPRLMTGMIDVDALDLSAFEDGMMRKA